MLLSAFVTTNSLKASILHVALVSNGLAKQTLEVPKLPTCDLPSQLGLYPVDLKVDYSI